MTKKYYTDIKLNSLPEREVEIVGTITAEKMALMREKALKKFRDDIELPGFRKGNAPEALVAQKIGEMRLLEEAAEIALSEEYPNILEEHNIDAIGRPEINVTKLAPGNEMGFKVRTALMPEIKLNDYKKVASKYSKVTTTPEVTEKEIDDQIKHIQKMIAHQKMHSENGDSHNHNHPAKPANAGRPDHAKHDHREIKDEDLPAIDDNFLKLLGNFKDIADLKTKMKESILAEKQIKEKDKRRTEMLEKIMEESTIDLPKIIVQGEMEKMLAQFKDDITKNGITYEEYLKHIKKTEEEIKAEWKDTAVKRAKSQVILNTIAKNEGIAPKEEDVKKEMGNIIAHHKDADRFRVRMYVETFMTNELVFQFLEKQ